MKPLVSASAPDGGKEIVGAETGVEALVARDQWDRPLILRPEGHLDPCVRRNGKGGGCKCMTGYTRVSTMAETLGDTFGLARWQKGNMLRGLTKRPDLVNAARLAATPGEMYEIVDQAELLGDNDVAARNGTIVHRLTERIDRGEDLPDGLPDNMVAMLEVYSAEMARHRFQVRDTEGFVVVDKIQVAGSFDKRMSGYVGDVKTGQNLDYMTMKVTMQVAMYAAGSYYDRGTGEREPLEVDRNRGVLIWLPYVERPEDAECEMRWLDLRLGRKMVMHAITTRDYRKLKPAQVMPRIK